MFRAKLLGEGWACGWRTRNSDTQLVASSCSLGCGDAPSSRRLTDTGAASSPGARVDGVDGVPVPTRRASSRLHLFPCELSPQLLTKEFPKHRAEAPSRTCLGTKTCMELVPARQFSLWKGGIARSWGLTGKHFWACGDRAGAGVGVIATWPLREKLSCLSASCLLSLLLFSTWLLLQANGTIEAWC